VRAGQTDAVRLPWIPALVATALTLSLVGPADAALAPVAAAPTAEPSAARASAQAPNVLLILTDDQRAGTEVGMPTVMSELAAKGTTYSHAFVPTSWCCPSRASLLSGKFAHNSGVWENGTASAWGAWAAFANGGEEADTLATRLNDAGYRTGLFGKYLNDTTLAGQDHVPPGWDEWEAFLGGNYERYRLSSDKGPVRKDRIYLTDALANRAVNFIRSTPRDQPVFTFFSPFAPHYPYDPGPYAGATRRAGLLDAVKSATNYPSPATNQADMSSYPAWMQKLPRSDNWDHGRERGKPMTIDEVVEDQADTLMAVDAAIARLLQTLRATGRLDNTLIVFTSDNGYAWGEHRLQGKNTPYDVSVRVPLIMRFDKGLAAGAVDPRVVGANVDVHASILDLTRVRPGRIDGVSVRASAREGLVMEAMRWVGRRGRPAYCGYRTADHLFVRYTTGEEELYDYTVDPFELVNVAADRRYADVRADLVRATRQACRPTPPGFSWDGLDGRLRAPSAVKATWIAPRAVRVTWRAPSGVGRVLPEYAVYLGRDTAGQPACTLESVRLTRGLVCRIDVGQDPRPWITVASVRDGKRVAARPVTPPRR
jgi:N-acetylglucosamine-6-sulfatase